jgi:hypothetical protein
MVQPPPERLMIAPHGGEFADRAPSLATYIVLQMNLHIDRQLQIFVIDEIAMRE